MRKIARAVMAACLVGLVLTAAAATTASAEQGATEVVKCKANIGKKAAQDKVEGAITTIDLVKFHLFSRFCYNGRRVLGPGHSCKTEVLDHVLIQVSGCSTAGFFIPWRGNPRGGYFVIGSFPWQNCLFIKLGCFMGDIANIERYLWADGLITKVPR